MIFHFRIKIGFNNFISNTQRLNLLQAVEKSEIQDTKIGRYKNDKKKQ
jgi:hypothetical protein